MKSQKHNLTIVFLLIAFFAAPGTAPAGELFDKVLENNIEAVKKLLTAGADINEQVIMGGVGTVTPLYTACGMYDDMAKLLIAKGADVNLKIGSGETPLMAACRAGKEEIARLLVSKGADVNAKSNSGAGAFSVCFFSILRGGTSTDIAGFLLSKGAKVDESSDGYTFLIMAAENKKPDLVKLLIKHGANVNAKAKDGSTPLGAAAKNQDAEMVKLLKSLGAK